VSFRNLHKMRRNSSILRFIIIIKRKKGGKIEKENPTKWSAMNQIPYIYSGTINDKSISEVLVGKEIAKIIEVEGDKRFWYAISDIKDIQVRIIKNNGTQEIMEELE